MDYGTAIAITVPTVAVVLSLTRIYAVKRTNGSGGNGHMTKEAKESTEKLWDEKQSKEQCHIISANFKEDVTEIKGGIKDIQKTLTTWGK